MTALEIREACACLMMLERDDFWWAEQGLSRIQPTLRDGWKALRQLEQDNQSLRERLVKITEQRDEAMSHAQALRGDFGDDACLQAEDALTELVNTVNQEEVQQ